MVAGVTFVTPAAAEAEELEVVEVGELAAVVRGDVSVRSASIANSLAQPPLGLTQAQVAVLVGVSFQAVSQWEAESKRVSNSSARSTNTPTDNRR